MTPRKAIPASYTDLKTGEKVIFFSRIEARQKLGVSESTFKRDLQVLLEMSLILPDWAEEKLRYVPRQRYWSGYQVECLGQVRYLTQSGREKEEIIAHLIRFGFPQDRKKKNYENRNHQTNAA